MSIIISNMNMPPGCQKCKFFRKHLFGNGLDYSYSCILGAKDFPMPWIRQMEEKASDCPIKPLPKGHGRLICEKEINTVMNGVFNVFDKHSPKTFLNVIHEQCIEAVGADEAGSEE